MRITTAPLDLVAAGKRIQYLAGVHRGYDAAGAPLVETMFGLNPDSGNGSIEWVITILAATIALLCVALASC